MQSAPFSLSVEGVEFRIYAINAHDEALIGANEYAEITDPSREYLQEFRGARQRLRTLPLPPLGQSLLEPMLDRMWQC